MMQAVVTGGTGTAAQIPGRQGRRQDRNRGDRRARDAEHDLVHRASPRPTTRRVAVAVVLENQRGSGGTTAAPIAKSIMEALLPGGSNH